MLVKRLFPVGTQTHQMLSSNYFSLQHCVCIFYSVPCRQYSKVSIFCSPLSLQPQDSRVRGTPRKKTEEGGYKMYMSTASELHSQVRPISECSFIPHWVTPVPTGMSEVCVSRVLLCQEKACVCMCKSRARPKSSRVGSVSITGKV